MKRPVLITGVEGLIGRSLRPRLERSGFAVRGLDLRSRADDERGDVVRNETVRSALRGCRGVVHLAAVSRIGWAELDPARALEVNVTGVAHVLRAALESPDRPWVLFASSREVYGSVSDVTVDEDAPSAPENHYARTKVMGESLVGDARRRGLRTAIVRLSNVYGDATDHGDRVVPAFVQTALAGRPLRVDGAGAFDFTHVRDVTLGLRRIIERLDGGETVPTLHLVSGRTTSLHDLARSVVEITGSASTIETAQSRPFGATTFRGDPARAWQVLQWRTRIALEVGLLGLTSQYRVSAARPPSAAYDAFLRGEGP